MSHHLVVGMLNPAMSAIFGVCLFVLWHYHRRLRYISIFAVSYSARALCFVVLYVAFVQQGQALLMLANGLILFATMLSSVALAKRFGQRPRYGALMAIGAISLAALIFYLTVEPSLSARGIVLNLAVAAIYLLMIVDVARLPNRTPVEQLLFCLLILACLGFSIRPLVFLFPGVAAEQVVEVYWIVVSTSDALICSMLAVGIFALIAVDVMDTIRSEAQVDALSGLLNRRGFESRALDALARQTAGAPAAMVLSDLDHFKSINDRFGHISGDRIIRTFSEILKDEAPREAIVARLGGEEFAVLLPPGYAFAAPHLAEAARAAFRERAPGVVSGATQPTVSFGIAVAREDESLPALLDRADRALYQAKNDGRDCIRQVA